VCKSVLWNRNYFLRFRFRLLKSYGSGSGSSSDFWQVPIPVPVPIPAPYLDHKMQIFQKKFGKNPVFLNSKLFYKEKMYKFHKNLCKMWMKKCLMKEIKYIIFKI
jgi:hypothetical protein